MKIHRMAIMAAIAPKMQIIMIAPIKEIIKPTMANPLCLLNIPHKEKTNPNNHNIQFITGNQHNKSPSNASTNPAVPIPFDDCCIIIVCLGWEVSFE